MSAFDAKPGRLVFVHFLATPDLGGQNDLGFHLSMVRPCVAREFRRYCGSGLASMYSAFDWSVLLLAIMDISACAISLAERPHRAIWVTSVRARREDRTSISSVLSQTSLDDRR